MNKQGHRQAVSRRDLHMTANRVLSSTPGRRTGRCGMIGRRRRLAIHRQHDLDFLRRTSPRSSEFSPPTDLLDF
jgi:plasmid stabilization system protein ParE